MTDTGASCSKCGDFVCDACHSQLVSPGPPPKPIPPAANGVGVEIGEWKIAGYCPNCGSPMFAKPNDERSRSVSMESGVTTVIREQAPPTLAYSCECVQWASSTS